MGLPHMVHGNQSLRTSHPQPCCCCSISSHPENSGSFLHGDWNSLCKAAGKVEVSERNRSPASPGGMAVSVSFDTRLHLQQAGPLLGSSTSVEGRCPSCTLLFNTDGGHPSHQTCSGGAYNSTPPVLLQRTAAYFPCLGLTKATGMAEKRNTQVRWLCHPLLAHSYEQAG